MFLSLIPLILYLILFILITGRNKVVAKVMFLLVSVILFTGGLPQCMLGYHTPQEQIPLRSRYPPGADTPRSRHPPEQTTPRADTPHPQSRHPHPQSRHPPEQTPPQSRHPLRADTPQEQTDPPRPDTPRSRHSLGADTHLGSRLRHTVNEQPVCILLECILVLELTVVYGTGTKMPHLSDIPFLFKTPSFNTHANHANEWEVA